MPTSEDLIVAKQVRAGISPFVEIPGLGKVTNAFAIVGPSTTNEHTFTVTGIQLATAIPATILLQARQGDNQDFGFPDVFALQVIKTDVDRLILRVKRLDSPTGWGQNLRVDMLIIEDVHS